MKCMNLKPHPLPYTDPTILNSLLEFEVKMAIFNIQSISTGMACFVSCFAMSLTHRVIMWFYADILK